MIEAAILFVSTFALVFLLGVQQLNVQHDHHLAAAATSLFIGISQLALYKLAPDAGGVEIAAYLAGGPMAIVCAMRVHPWLRRWSGGMSPCTQFFRRWRARRRAAALMKCGKHAQALAILYEAYGKRGADIARSLT